MSCLFRPDSISEKSAVMACEPTGTYHAALRCPDCGMCEDHCICDDAASDAYDDERGDEDLGGEG